MGRVDPNRKEGGSGPMMPMIIRKRLKIGGEILIISSGRRGTRTR